VSRPVCTPHSKTANTTMSNAKRRCCATSADVKLSQNPLGPRGQFSGSARTNEPAISHRSVPRASPSGNNAEHHRCERARTAPNKVGGASQLVEAQIGRSRENCRVRKNVKELNRRETKRCDRKQSFCRSGLGGTLPDK
jgi:hypothetical protein